MASAKEKEAPPVTDSYRRLITFLLVTFGATFASIGIMNIETSNPTPDKASLSPAGIIGEFPHANNGTKAEIILGAVAALSPLVFKGVPKPEPSKAGKINDYG